MTGISASGGVPDHCGLAYGQKGGIGSLLQIGASVYPHTEREVDTTKLLHQDDYQHDHLA